MSLTKEQLEVRRKGVGASEAAAVLGLPYFFDAAHVYYQKIMDMEPDKPTPSQDMGNRLEPWLIEQASERLGAMLAPCETIFHPSLAVCCTPDSRVVDAKMLVQAKAVRTPDGWGEEDTDEIPDPYVVQVQHEMEVCNAAGIEVEEVVMPVFVGVQMQVRFYRVRRHETLGKEIVTRCDKWFRDHVIPRIPPADAPPPLDFLKRLRREPKSTVMLGQQAVEALAALEAAKEVAKHANKDKEEKQAAVVALLGIDDPAEEGILPDGTVIRYMEQSRSGYEVKATTFRQLKVKKATS